MTGGWPYPGDSPIARARRAARAYRARLHAADPDACAELDELMTQWGERWLAPALDLGTSLDDWLTPAQAADLAAITPATLRTWRHRGRITGRQRQDGTWEYLARDILELATATRHRTPSQLRSTPTAPVRPYHGTPTKAAAAG